ncbi:MAG: hypothetical protein ABIT83_24235 [Massilia sp.]
MNSDDMNDAQFDAFLNGEDELSRQLQSLPQQAPSAALDAAILGHATLAMARQAANDPAPADAAPPMRRLSARWTVPAGIAATVLVGVLAKQSWQSADQHEAMEYRAPAAAVALEVPPPMPAPQTSMPSLGAPPVESPPRLAIEAKKIKPEVAPTERRREKPAPVPGAVAAMADAPAPVAVPMPPPPPAPEAAPVAAPPSPFAPLATTQARAPSNSAPMFAPRAPTVTVQGRNEFKYTAKEPLAGHKAAIPVDAIVAEDVGQLPPLADKSNGAPVVVADPGAEQWLALIDEMLKAGLRADAVAEWTRFRLVHPAYPIPLELNARISAARK